MSIRKKLLITLSLVVATAISSIAVALAATWMLLDLASNVIENLR